MEVAAASDLDNLKATELRLGLPGIDAPEKPAPMSPRGSKRALLEANMECWPGTGKSLESDHSSDQEAQPMAKAQVVGWPPIRSYRKNSFKARKEEMEAAELFVKVSMDGAPYLRKIDLKVYKAYKELREALDNMFRCFSTGELSGMEGCNGSEYAITYEDKDCDWMLVGDVPWEMFISGCKRLRIMRRSEATGMPSSP